MVDVQMSGSLIPVRAGQGSGNEPRYTVLLYLDEHTYLLEKILDLCGCSIP